MGTSEQELAAIRARCEAATPGPWYVIEAVGGRADIGTDPNGWAPLGHPPVDVTWGPEGDRALRIEDAEFVAHARDDVPALLAEVERLRLLVSRFLLGHDEEGGIHNDSGDCVWCGERLEPYGGAGHEPGCPWLAAREALR